MTAKVISRKQTKSVFIKNNQKNLTKGILLLGFVAVVIIGLLWVQRSLNQKNKVHLYWFIPDGVRAEPFLFNVFAWASEGKLPNIKKLMDKGSYGYSYPNFPSHTPTNFAALLTGTYPEINGVDDGPMRAVGKPLDTVAVAGFRSTARKIPAIWKTLEDAGRKVAIISVPGSTPPEIEKGVVIRGRWGGWGADFAAVNFEMKGDSKQRVLQGRGTKLFFFGPQLTQYIDGNPVSGWNNPPESYSPATELHMEAWGKVVYGYLYDSTDDGKKNYDTVAFSKDKQTVFASLRQGQWSSWEPVSLVWKTDTLSLDVPTSMKIAVIKISDDGFFRIRFFYDNMNEHIVFPGSVAEIIEKDIGPMTDFADNFPAQLIYYPEDKKIFIDEANMTFDWHKKIVTSIIQRFSPNVVIHDIYTPNQMLTSRWWMGYIDPQSSRYAEVSDNERANLWLEVQDMYKKLDVIVGEILANTDENAYIVFSSDHGNVPLNTYVNLNNFFAQRGWLRFTINPNTGEPNIDWKNSKVIYLKMAHIYIHPDGLDGNYERASGPEYESLRNEVIRSLSNLQDQSGVKPVVEIVKWEDAKNYMQLDPDRIGDLVIANAPGYGWNEEMTNDMQIFSEPGVTGYKQALLAKDLPGMWTPFIISGPGIRKNHFLGETPFSLIDQYPTILKALHIQIPSVTQGKSLPIFNDGR